MVAAVAAVIAIAGIAGVVALLGGDEAPVAQTPTSVEAPPPETVATDATVVPEAPEVPTAQLAAIRSEYREARRGLVAAFTTCTTRAQEDLASYEPCAQAISLASMRRVGDGLAALPPVEGDGADACSAAVAGARDTLDAAVRARIDYFEALRQLTLAPEADPLDYRAKEAAVKRSERRDERAWEQVDAACEAS